MIKKQLLSLFFSLLLSSSLVCASGASSQPEKKVSTPIRLAKNIVYGTAHGGLAASSGLFCFCAATLLAQTGNGAGNGRISLNLDAIFTFIAISGGIPSVYGLYAGLKGVYVALEDSYYALTETADSQIEEKAKPETQN